MPIRKSGSWQYELPPFCAEKDYTGASHENLVKFIQSVDAAELKTKIIAYIEQHGCTHNQRALLQASCEAAVSGEGTRMVRTGENQE